jgi:hypothetical protein
VIDIPEMMYQKIKTGGRKVFGFDLFVQFRTKPADMKFS